MCQHRHIPFLLTRSYDFPHTVYAKTKIVWYNNNSFHKRCRYLISTIRTSKLLCVCVCLITILFNSHADCFINADNHTLIWNVNVLRVIMDYKWWEGLRLCSRSMPIFDSVIHVLLHQTANGCEQTSVHNTNLNKFERIWLFINFDRTPNSVYLLY